MEDFWQEVLQTTMFYRFEQSSTTIKTRMFDKALHFSIFLKLQYNWPASVNWKNIKGMEIMYRLHPIYIKLQLKILLCLTILIYLCLSFFPNFLFLHRSFLGDAFRWGSKRTSIKEGVCERSICEFLLRYPSFSCLNEKPLDFIFAS